MTETIFQTDAYAREFDAVVTAVDTAQDAIALDRTAFYPGGGGQPCDHGSIRTSTAVAAVQKVRREGGEIWHFLKGPVPAVGDSLHATLDWARRHALMRTHTALHILCGVVWRDYSAQVTGGNMEPLRGRLDFEFETLKADLIAEIETKLNAEVEAARDVKVAILPRAEAFEIPDLIRTKINLLPESLTEIRTVEIEGLDLQADGGTHVGNTSEVGPIRIARYKSKGRINKRIEVALES